MLGGLLIRWYVCFHNGDDDDDDDGNGDDHNSDDDDDDDDDDCDDDDDDDDYDDDDDDDDGDDGDDETYNAWLVCTTSNTNTREEIKAWRNRILEKGNKRSRIRCRLHRTFSM